jgi:hypothetical protein
MLNTYPFSIPVRLSSRITSFRGYNTLGILIRLDKLKMYRYRKDHTDSKKIEKMVRKVAYGSWSLLDRELPNFQ